MTLVCTAIQKGSQHNLELPTKDQLNLLHSNWFTIYDRVAQLLLFVKLNNFQFKSDFVKEKKTFNILDWKSLIYGKLVDANLNIYCLFVAIFK